LFSFVVSLKARVSVAGSFFLFMFKFLHIFVLGVNV
jgi:hypothetical protein